MGAAAWRFAVCCAAVACAFVTASASSSARARYADGPPDGFSGGFGEDSCRACHFEAELNEAPGRLSLSGVPVAYTPGRTYALTIALARPGMALAGFQLTARFEDGTQAGTLAVPAGWDDRVAVGAAGEGAVQYAHQREGGTRPSSDGGARWTVQWTAPDARADAVLFHVAANAADGDGSASGDYVYTVAAASLPE